MLRYGMVIDLRKCIGCHACTMACKAENGTRPGIFWNLVLDLEVGKYPSVTRLFIPRLCMHCENALCVEVCPTGATYKREDGIVMIDESKCVGCKQCILACPYGARYLNRDRGGYFGTSLIPTEDVTYRNHELGVAEKCTFCADRVQKGQEPICVKVCPVAARTFGDLNNPNSEVSQLIRSKHGFQLLREMGTDPSVYYLSA